MGVYLEHTASIEQNVMRVVICEECDCEFVYEMTVSGSGTENSTIFYSGRAPEKARKKAKEEFRDNMKYGCRALPCPECAYYQKHMLSTAKWEKAGKWVVGGVVAGVALIILGIFLWKYIGFSVVGLGVVAGGGLLGVGLYVHNSYDPNDLPERERFRLAEGETIARAEFEDIFRDKYATAYRRLCDKIDEGRDTKQKVAGQFFADPDQVYEECRLKAELPNGDPVRVQLESDMKSGEKFTYEREYKGHTIRFDYELVVYTETKKRKK